MTAELGAEGNESSRPLTPGPLTRGHLEAIYGNRDKVAEGNAERPRVWLVVMAGGGLFGVYDNVVRARQAAEHIEGILVSLPIHIDFRRRLP